MDYSDVDGTELESPNPLVSDGQTGKELYEIFCLVCHGSKGLSETKTAAKMDVSPFEVAGEGTAELTDGELFVKIVASDSVMPKYRNELNDEEAWEIVGYLRYLQRKLQ